MADVEDLRIVLRSEVDKAISGLKKASRQSKQSSKDWSDLNKNFKNQVKASLDLKNAYGQMVMQIASGIGVFTLVSGAIRGMTQLVGESVEAFKVQEQAVAKLDAVLRATGGAAGYTSAELQAFAGELQNMTAIGDEEIINMQAILASFKSVSGEVFKSATSTVLDLSKAFDQDLSSTAKQVGKALDDPVTGVSALRKVGVSFSQDQIEMIKSLVETGDKAEAQRLILRELESQVGGVAQVMANTASGAMQQYKNVVGDTKEEIGRFILNGLEPLTRVFTDVAAAIQGVIKEQNDYNEALKAVDEALKAVDEGTASTNQRLLVLETERKQLEELIEWNDKYQGHVSSYNSRSSQQTDAARARLAIIKQEQVELAKAIVLEARGTEAARERAEELARAAEEERKRAEEKQNYLDRVNQMYAQTSEGRIAALEQEIAEFEKYAKTAQDEAPQVAAVLEMLNEQLENLKNSGKSDTGGISEELERINQLYSRTPEAIAAAKEETLQFVKTQRALAMWTGATAEELKKYDAILNDLQKDANAGGEGSDPKTELEIIQGIFDELNKDLKNMLNNVIQGGLVDGFVAIGDALATGADSGQAFGQIMQQAGADAMRQISRFALTAGMRILAETGSAGLPVALALFGIAGISGIGSGALSSKRMTDTYILDINTDPIVKAERELRDERIRLLKEQLEIEKKLRKEAIDKLKENFDLEYDVLKDLWERNIISTSEFESRSGALREERDKGIEGEEEKVEEAEKKVREEEERQAQEIVNARDALLNRVRNAVATINDFLYRARNDRNGPRLSRFEYNGLKDLGERIESLIGPVSTAADMGTISAYKNKVDEYSRVATGTFDGPAFAKGGDFITSGPRMIMVGDNPGGRERVRIDPISSTNFNGSGSGGVVIQINAPVYGVDDLYEKLERAGKRLNAQGRRTGVLV